MSLFQSKLKQTKKNRSKIKNKHTKQQKSRVWRPTEINPSLSLSLSLSLCARHIYLISQTIELIDIDCKEARGKLDLLWYQYKYILIIVHEY